MPELINKWYDLQYVIAWRDNGEKENLQKKAQDLWITDKIHYLWFIDKEEKLSALTHADIIAIPSETESYGLVALEWRAYWKNIVTTFAWWLQDALDWYNWAYKIEEIEDALKWKEIPDKKISDFYWEEIGKKYLLKI